MTFLTVWRFLRSVPASLYAGVALFVALVAAWALVASSIDKAYKRGHDETLAGAHFDSTLLALTDSIHAAKRAKTDTVVRVVTKVARRVDSVAIRIPDTLRIAYPVVDTLVVESQRLVVAVDSLTHTLADERNASALLVGTLRGQLTQSRLETGREHDMVIALSKRPTRLKAVGFALASAGLGYAAGKR